MKTALEFTFTGLVVEDNHIFADEPQHRHVCDFADAEFTEEETGRIQRLFAASPDLLAALEAVREAFPDLAEFENKHGESLAHLDAQITAALAKATA